jgi:hypothetical protein
MDWTALAQEAGGNDRTQSVNQGRVRLAQNASEDHSRLIVRCDSSRNGDHQCDPCNYLVISAENWGTEMNRNHRFYERPSAVRLKAPRRLKADHNIGATRLRPITESVRKQALRLAL